MGRTGDSLDNELPPRSGGGSPLREELLIGRKRGGPWMRWLLLLLNNLITIRILLLSSPDHVGRCGSSPVYILQEMVEKQIENQWPAQSAFCCCNSFWVFWRPKTDQNSFGKMCKTHFTGLLAAVPCIRVLQTTAGVMPEHWRSPNLALNTSSKSSFSSFLHTNAKEFHFFFARAFFVVLFAAPPTKCTTNLSEICAIRILRILSLWCFAFV